MKVCFVVLHLTITMNFLDFSHVFGHWIIWELSLYHLECFSRYAHSFSFSVFKLLTVSDFWPPFIMSELDLAWALCILGDGAKNVVQPFHLWFVGASTNHRVRLLTPLWGPRSKSYFRGKDKLRKEFSIARVSLTCFNYRLSYQSAGRKYLSFKTSLNSHDTSELDSLTNAWLTFHSIG